MTHLICWQRYLVNIELINFLRCEMFTPLVLDIIVDSFIFMDFLPTLSGGLMSDSSRLK